LAKQRLKRPLNKQAIQAADDEFYAKHPDMMRNGHRVPLDPNNPRHAAMRQAWHTSYLANGGELSNADMGQSEVDKPVRPCERDDHWIEFRYVMGGTDFPVSDKEAFTLVYPTGKTEEATLSGGKLRRDGVPAGMYELRPKSLGGVSWSPSTAHAEEPVTVEVTGLNIPDGETVEIRILGEFQLTEGKPVATVSATFDSDSARAQWNYKQEIGAAPDGRFIAIAKWSSKTAKSNVLTIEHYPVGDDKGLQQRLKHLGHYAGAIDGIVGPASRSAVSALQREHPPLAVDGIAGPLTRGLLERLLY